MSDPVLSDADVGLGAQLSDSDVGLSAGVVPQQPRGWLSKLSETWPARIAKEVASAVTLPGDVYTGKVRPTQTLDTPDGPLEIENPEYMQRTVGLAAVASPVPAAMRGGESWAGTVRPRPAPPTLPKTIGDFDVPLTVGEATGNLGMQIEERAALRGGRGARAQEVAKEFVDEREAALSAARGTIARGLDPAKTIVAKDPLDAAEIVASGAQGAARAAKDAYQAAYKDFADVQGQFAPGTFSSVGTTIRKRLDSGANPVVVDDRVTPVASAALGDIEKNLGDLLSEKPLSIQGLDQARKRLGTFFSAAKSSGNPSDMRAMGRIADELSGVIEDKITSNLFTGDETAYATWMAARRAFADYKNMFGVRGAGDDAGRVVKKILGSEGSHVATTTEIANYLYGAANVGAKGVSVRVAQRLKPILGESSPEWSALRQGLWEKLVTPTEGRTAWGPQKVSERVLEFVNGSGRQLANTIFSQPEREIMLRYAELLKKTTPEAGAVNYSNNLPMLHKIMDATNKHVTTLVGAHMHGASGAVAGNIVGRGLASISDIVAARRTAQLMPTLEQSLVQFQKAQAQAAKSGVRHSQSAQRAREMLARSLVALGVSPSIIPQD